MPVARYVEATVEADLADKMVFLAGPRQVGKTTLARAILARADAGAYYSWDRREDRADLHRARWPGGRALVVLDEIHKYRHWKRWLKGEYDTHRERLRFLVTGSARLEVYRRGGDSLQGRYHHYRLHPFSLAEAEGHLGREEIAPGGDLPFDPRARRAPLDALMAYSGFPEPFLAQDARRHRRWRDQRLDRFFREDVRDLEAVRDLSLIQILADLVAERVGSPLSLNAMREDLEVSHRAVTHWVEILDRLYHLFRVPPYASRRIRALKKMPKAYLWDWTLVADRGARFENLLAAHLLKLCHLLRDRDGHRVELHYLRDTSGREVDFLVTCEGRPWFAVEAKAGQDDIAPALRYHFARLGIPRAYQVVLDGTRDYAHGGIRCLPAHVFLSGLA